MKDGSSPDALRKVRHTAERMARARGKSPTFWRQLAHVGVLGWMFAIPTIAGAFLGRFLGRVTGSEAVAVGVLVAGVVVGVYSVYRQVKKSLDEDPPEGGAS